MTRCIQNHTVVSDHHQHCHEHAANDNDNATVTDIFEDHPHDILIQGIPEYFRFADPTGVYGILDEIDILTQRMENYPINLILAPGTLEKVSQFWTFFSKQGREHEVYVVNGEFLRTWGVVSGRE